MTSRSKPLRTFQTRDFGLVRIEETTYADGNLAIVLWEHGDDKHPWSGPIAKLSVNLPPASSQLPPGCFLLKHWSENAEIAQAAKRSGWIRRCWGFDPVPAGYEWAEVWQLLDERSER